MSVPTDIENISYNIHSIYDDVSLDSIFECLERSLPIPDTILSPGKKLIKKSSPYITNVVNVNSTQSNNRSPLRRKRKSRGFDNESLKSRSPKRRLPSVITSEKHKESDEKSRTLNSKGINVSQEGKPKMDLEEIEKKRVMLPYLDQIKYVEYQLIRRGVLNTYSNDGNDDYKIPESMMVKTVTVVSSIKNENEIDIDRQIAELEANRPQNKKDTDNKTDISNDNLQDMNSSNVSKRKLIQLNPEDPASTTSSENGDKNQPVVFSPRKKLRSSHGTDATCIGEHITDWTNDKQEKLRLCTPRFFEKLDALETDGELQSPIPRIHHPFWLLQLIEEIFDFRYEFELGKRKGVGKRKKIEQTEILRQKQKEKATSDPEHFEVMAGHGLNEVVLPYFIFAFIREKFGLVDLVSQGAWDMLYNAQEMIDDYPQVKVFIFCLRELYDEDDLLMYLHSRYQLQHIYGLSLKTKGKLLEPSGSKKNTPMEWIHIVNHPLMNDGTKEVYLSKNAVKHLFTCILDNEDKAAFLTDNLGDKFKARKHVSKILTISYGEILYFALMEFKKTPNDIINEVKFNDKGDSGHMLDQLQKTMRIDKDLEILLETEARLTRELAALKFIHADLLRKNHKQNGALRTQVFLANNNYWSKEQEVSEIRIKMNIVSQEKEKIWNESTKDPPILIANTPKFDLDQESILGKTLSLVLVRFQMHVDRLYSHHLLKIKAAKLISTNWGEQLEALRERTVLKLQRIFRKRRADRIAKEEASKILGEKREKRRLNEAAIKKRQEEEMRIHTERLHAKLKKEEEEKAAQEAKRRAIVNEYNKKVREERIRNHRVTATSHAFFCWKVFLLTKKKLKIRELEDMNYRFGRWKSAIALIKEQRAAATRLQAIARQRAAKKELERMKAQQAHYESVVKKCLFRLQNKVITQIFNSLSVYTKRMKAVRRMAGASLGNFLQFTFNKWLSTVEEIKQDKQWAANYIQKMYRGRIGKKKFRSRKVLIHSAMKIQRWWRCVLAKKLLKSLTKKKIDQNEKLSKSLKKMFRKTLYKCFMQLRRNADNNIRVRGHLKEKMMKSIASCLVQWKDYIIYRKELKQLSAVQIQSLWRGVVARKMVEKLRLERRSAIKIQRFWRYILDLKRKEEKRRRMFAATVIQKRWRGMLGRRKFKKELIDSFFQGAHSVNYSVVTRCFERGYGNILDKSGNTLLHIAAKTGSKRLVKLCLKNGIGINSTNYIGKTPLHFVASGSTTSSKLLDYMIMHGSKADAPDYEGNTPLMEAARVGNIQILNELIKNGASIDGRTKTGLTALHCAIHENRVQIVKKLLELGADPDTRDDEKVTALHDAANNGYLDCANWILHFKGHINIQDKDGFTPLHIAAASGRFDMVRLLVEAENININARDRTLSTPLHYAVVEGHGEIAEYLCENGALINLIDKDGDSALHVAAYAGQAEMVSLLLGFGADSKLRNKSGEYAVHAAARNGQLASIRAFVDYDCDLNVKNYAGRTPLGEARINGHEAVVDYFHLYFKEEIRTDLNDMPEEPVVVKQDHNWERRVDVTRGTYYFNTETKEERETQPPEMSGWIRKYDEDSKRHYYYNTTTGIYQWSPPDPLVISKSAVPSKVLYKRVMKVIGKSDVNVDEYMKFFEAENTEIKIEQRKIHSAIVIQTKWRSVRAKRKLRKLSREHHAIILVQKRARIFIAKRAVERKRKELAAAILLQSLWRGHKMRKIIWANILQMRWDRLVLTSAMKIQRYYKGHLARRMVERIKFLSKHLDFPFDEWQEYAAKSRKRAEWNGWVELVFPGSLGLLYYHHTFTRQTQWAKPEDWIANDKKLARQAVEMRTQGYTTEMWNAAKFLQKAWHKKKEKVYYRILIRSMRVMKYAEEKYLNRPGVMTDIVNYMLFQHVMKHKYDDARKLYDEAIRLMTQRGPDLPIVLYAYAIFLCATGEEDWGTIAELIWRARQADTDGESFRFAYLGFFRLQAMLDPNNTRSCLNYALCLQWYPQKYEESEEWYLRAIMINPYDKLLIDNFSYMLQLANKPYTAYEAVRRHQEKMAAEYAKEWKKAEDEKNEIFAATFVQSVYRGWKARTEYKKKKRLIEQGEYWEPVNDDSGNIYFYNRSTGAMRWDKPPSETITTKQQKEETQTKGKDIWEVLQDDNGKTYWYNSNTGETTYVNPNRKKIIWNDENFEEAIDGHGIKYYYNVKTGESRRVLPSKAIASVTAEDEEEDTQEDKVEELFDWEEISDDEGQIYYYSPSRNESRWTLPEQEVKPPTTSLFDNEEYATQFQQEIEKSGKWTYAPLEEPSVPGKRVYFYTASNGQVVKVEF